MREPVRRRKIHDGSRRELVQSNPALFFVLYFCPNLDDVLVLVCAEIYRHIKILRGVFHEDFGRYNVLVLFVLNDLNVLHLQARGDVAVGVGNLQGAVAKKAVAVGRVEKELLHLLVRAAVGVERVALKAVAAHGKQAVVPLPQSQLGVVRSY